MKTKYMLILLALGLGLALVYVLGGGSTPIAAAPVLPVPPVLSRVEGPSRTADILPAIEGPRAESHIEAPSAPAAEDSTEPTKVLRVCPSGCTYSSIQGAVDAADDGDLIKVATGTYTDVNHRDGLTQVVYIDKTVTVRGGYTTDNWATSHPVANPTTLDARGLGRVLYITGDISPTIEGLRITGGDAYGLPGQSSTGAGGGMYVVTATAVLIDNYVFDNTAENGGGVCLHESDATVTDNIISRNAARGGGGLVLWSSDAVLNDNTITGNSAEWGGGLFLDNSDATLTDSTITNNTAEKGGGGLFLNGGGATISGNTITDNTVDGGEGGGLLLQHSDATLNGNIIAGNTTTWGGGLYLRYSDSTLNDNIIRDNTATWRGGGLFLSFGDSTLNGNTIRSNTADRGGGLDLSHSHVTLINNTVTDNQANDHGSGLYIDGSSPRLVHTTIARNIGGDGSGIYVGDGTATLINTILASHSVGISVTKGNTVTISGVLWHNTPISISGSATAFVEVQNQHTGDPAFVNPGAGDYHIGPGSAAIDAGVDAGVDHDIDGDPRPAAFGFDIGADERPGASLHINGSWSPYRNSGQTLTYTLVVTSVGVDSVTDVWLTGTLPTLQQVVAITTTWGSCTVDTGWGGTGTCDLGTMAPDASVRIALTAQVTTTPPAQLPWSMRNTIWVKAIETSNTFHADTMLHDCHVRLNDGPTEYTAIQAGVNASTWPTDVVKVSGYCVGVTSRAGVAQIVYLDKTLTLQGGWNTAFTQRDVTSFPTTLDAWGQGRVLYITPPPSGAPISPIIEALRITGGDATGLGGGRDGNVGELTYDTGGGVYINGMTVFKDNQVFSNTAEWGGGLYLRGSDATLINNVIADNQGDGVVASSAHLLHNTIAHNSGAGVNAGNNLALTNTILVSNTIGISGTATLEATLWGAGTWANETDWTGGTITGTVNLWGDPAFVDPDGGDYHIGISSAAIDAGVDAGVVYDIDGEPRPLGSGYDLGADEAGLFVTKRAFPDPVQPGAPLTYTIHITNVTGIDLHANITDTLPLSVTLDKASGGTLILPGGTLAPPDGTVDLPDGRVAVVWTDVITVPGGLWVGTIVVTVDEGYTGPLVNLVEVTTEEGVQGSDSVTVVAGRHIYLPMVMREFS